MFELKVTLQKMLSIKGEDELEILVGSTMRGDRKLDVSVSAKLLASSDVSYCSKSTLKSSRRKIFFEFCSLHFLKNDSLILDEKILQ